MAGREHAVLAPRLGKSGHVRGDEGVRRHESTTRHPCVLVAVAPVRRCPGRDVLPASWPTVRCRPGESSAGPEVGG